MRADCFTVVLAAVAGTISCGDGKTGGDADAGDTATESVGNWECYDGSYVIESAADAEELAKYLCVTEDLTVDSPDLEGLSLPELKKVQGAFTIIAPKLTTLELPVLTEVGGVLKVKDTPLEGLGAFGLLESVTEIELEGCAELVTLGGLAGLVDLASLTVSGCPVLAAIDPPKIMRSGWIKLVIEGNNQVAHLGGLVRVTRVEEELRIEDNPALPTCDVCELIAQLSEEPDSLTHSGNGDDDCVDASGPACPEPE